jgi:alanine dehydrogenase
VLELMSLAACRDAVGSAFVAHALGGDSSTLIAGLHLRYGTVHVKAAALPGPPARVATKINANFPGNPERHGLPTIQGLVLLADGDTGRPLALLDSGSVTALRTAAATALAAGCLALPEADTAVLVGCGAQSRLQLRALHLARPLRQGYAFDAVPERAAAFAAEMKASLGIPIEATRDLRSALARSRLCVTCTTATRPVLGPGDLLPGTFVAAVGADNESKIELDPVLLATCRVVTDLTAQAASIGDLHHALSAGTMTMDQVHAELGEVLSGRRPGRTGVEETFVFDSTGTALQDVAAASLVYDRAVAEGRGTAFRFGE